jgi:TetR/AcrR family transcriptional regulator of autoinduction and epiphytic fitness
VRAKSLRGSSSDLTTAVPLSTALEPTRPDDEPADGRAARSYRTRQAIIDAMRALHAEGDLRPTAPRIAARAGVSLRTVWQQFTDKEELLAEAVRRDLEILLSLVEKIEPDQPLEARIETFVSQRTRVLEEMTPSWRAARVHEPFSAHLRRNKLGMIARAKAEVEKVFAPELLQVYGKKRQQLLETLHAISLWEFWESLRSDLGLGPQQARELLSTTFATLLSQAAAA